MTEVIVKYKVSLSTMGYIALIALSTLFYELSLIRILDVLWYPHFAYMVITFALLGFGIAGVVTSIIADRIIEGSPIKRPSSRENSYPFKKKIIFLTR